MLLVLSLRTTPNSRSQRFFPMFSSIRLIILAPTFKPKDPFWVNFYVWYLIEVQMNSFTCGHSFAPALFVENTICWKEYSFPIVLTFCQKSVVSLYRLLILFHWLICCCCSVTHSCLILCNPTDCSMPGNHVLHHLLELDQTHVHWVGDAIQPSCPLSSPSPPASYLSQHQGLFQWVSSS